jgi:hypothetical protein
MTVTPRNTFGGELEKQVLDTYRLGADLDPCEKSTEEKLRRLKIVRALDARALEFKNFQRSNPKSFTGEAIKVGPLTLIPRESQTPASVKTDKNGWSSFKMGWDDFEREYLEIAQQRMSKRWVRLLGLVQTTAEDDYLRAVKGEWMGASAAGVAEAKTLLDLIENCLSEKVCTGLEDPAAFKDALLLSPNGASDYSDYLKAKEVSDQERALQNLSDGIQPFTRILEPVKQPGVRLSDDHTLVVSLDPGQFRGYETDLSELISKFWNLNGQSLTVEWMTSTRDEPLFKFLFSPAAKSPSYVDYKKRSIIVGQESRESVLAHLVGRALGFRARYFSTWRPETCQYEDQQKPGDLLSDARNGSVLPEHWEAIKNVYKE